MNGDAPDGLQARGRALWAALGEVENTPGGVLALEACRAADRLDELDSIIAGKGVLELMRFRVMGNSTGRDEDEPMHVKVHFDNALGEARQQQNNLRQMLLTLGAGSAKGSGAGQGGATSGAPASAVDEFTARRRERGA